MPKRKIPDNGPPKTFMTVMAACKVEMVKKRFDSELLGDETRNASCAK